MNNLLAMNIEGCQKFLLDSLQEIALTGKSEEEKANLDNSLLGARIKYAVEKQFFTGVYDKPSISQEKIFAFLNELENIEKLTKDLVDKVQYFISHIFTHLYESTDIQYLSIHRTTTGSGLYKIIIAVNTFRYNFDFYSSSGIAKLRME